MLIVLVPPTKIPDPPLDEALQLTMDVPEKVLIPLVPLKLLVATQSVMSEPFPDPTQLGSPSNPSNVDIPGPLFKRAWLAMMAVIVAAVAVIVGFQLFG